MSNHRIPKYALYRSLWRAVDWLFPPTCGGCGSPGSSWCDPCHQGTAILSTIPTCRICGRPWEAGRACPSCQQTPPAFSQLVSWALFSGSIRNAIHRFKYRNDIGMGETLSSFLLDIFNQAGWDVDLIIPVPLNRKRHRQRGYNQAILLARPLSLATGIPMSTSALIRNRPTHSQVGLNFTQRIDNVHAAFTADSKEVKSKCVLLIDDVATTGATLNACSEALQKAQAGRVFALTLTRAALGSDSFHKLSNIKEENAFKPNI
jgi:competence protein ComFC